MPKYITGFIWWVLPSTLVLMLAYPHIAGPFTGDQALYAYGGQAILDGQLMYRDFVDIKHPGVHYYYSLALLLFSSVASAEVSVHVLELIIWLGLGLFLQQVLKSRLSNPSLAAIAPLALGGAYYATVGPGGLSQIEALPGPIICLGIWLACGASIGDRVGSIRSFLAGVALSCVVIFHGHMVLVAIVIIAVAGLRYRNLIALVSGFVVSLAAVAGYFAAHGGWPGLWEVYVSYPFAAGDEVPAEPGGFMRIRWNISGFVYDFAPWVVLAALVLLRLPRLVKDTFALQHLLWGAVALATMLLETRTSWPFHFLYFVVPVGVLAVYGADSLASLLGRHGRSIAAIAGLAALATSVLNHWSHLADDQDKVFDVNARISAETEFLRQDDAIGGPIYIFGSPIYLKESERRQALPRNGWGWEVGLASHWAELSTQLRDVKPGYIYVSSHYGPLIRDNAPDILTWLKTNYRETQLNSHGHWYSLLPE